MQLIADIMLSLNFVGLFCFFSTGNSSKTKVDAWSDRQGPSQVTASLQLLIAKPNQTADQDKPSCRNQHHPYFSHSKHFCCHFHTTLEVPCPLLCFHQMFVV